MIEQLFIAVFGVASIWLANDERYKIRRWACVFGLLGQPFWMISAWQAQQWGILALTFFYTAAWVKGVRANWICSTEKEDGN